MIFLILFIMIPLIEIALFMTIGGEIGVLWTLLMCAFTALLGGSIIRVQGLGTLLSARNRMENNQMPVKEMLDGLCLAFAGATLITPGFFTDAIGFALLIPPVRHFIQQYLIRNFSAKVFDVGGQGDFHNSGRQSPYQNANNNVIDAEYERIDDNDSDDKS